MSISLFNNIKGLAAIKTAPNGEPYLSLSAQATLRLARSRNLKLKEIVDLI